VGGVLACLLGRQSLRVLVLEREPAPYPLPRAVAFDAEVMRVLQTIGIVEKLKPAIPSGTGGMCAAKVQRTAAFLLLFGRIGAPAQAEQACFGFRAVPS
jgi:2-polyprenyl-6-methoxyphenol hydroxylase-like FAD-dependent oxidoreductase